MLIELRRQREAYREVKDRLASLRPPEPPKPLPEPPANNVVAANIPVVRPYGVFRKYPTFDDIMGEICRYFRVNKLDLVSARRTADIVKPRQIFFYLCRTMTTKSFPEIGRAAGGRDHTTALHGVRKIEAMLAGDPDGRLSDDVDLLRLRIGEVVRQRNAPFEQPPGWMGY